MQIIELQYPIEVNGATVSTITLRRPTVRDRLVAEKAGGSEAEREIRLIANLGEMAPADVELLDMADYVKIQEHLTDFLS